MDVQLQHRGFTGSAIFDPRTGRHEGLLLGVPDRVLYQASTLESLVANFEAAVDEYIQFLDLLREADDEALLERPVIDLFVRSGVERSVLRDARVTEGEDGLQSSEHSSAGSWR